MRMQMFGREPGRSRFVGTSPRRSLGSNPSSLSMLGGVAVCAVVFGGLALLFGAY
jgi:hypothetical protein